MTETEMRRVSRKELLELLIEQTKENEALRAALSEAEGKLQSRDLLVEQSGTLAEAALSVSRVLEAADEAAALYLENAKRIEKETQEKYEAMLAKAGAEVEEMLEKGRTDADAIRAKGNAEAEAMLAYARTEAEAILARSRRTEPENPSAKEPETGFRLFGFFRSLGKKQ